MNSKKGLEPVAAFLQMLVEHGSLTEDQMEEKYLRGKPDRELRWEIHDLLISAKLIEYDPLFDIEKDGIHTKITDQGIRWLEEYRAKFAGEG